MPELEPRLNLFVSDNELYELVGEGTEHEAELQYNGPWPVVVWFTAMDALVGDGWCRNEFEQHGKILNHYAHDVGSGDKTEAVLVEVPTLADLLALALTQRFELCDKVPSNLYG